MGVCVWGKEEWGQIHTIRNVEKERKRKGIGHTNSVSSDGIGTRSARLGRIDRKNPCVCPAKTHGKEYKKMGTQGPSPKSINL